MLSQLPPEKRPFVIPTGPEFSVCGGRLVEIVLPPPHPALHSHNKGHWSKRAKLVKMLRWLANIRAKKALEAHPKVFGTERPAMPTASVGYVFYVPDDRVCDAANMIHSQKAAIDGIVDSGLIAGDRWQLLSIAGVDVRIDAKNPRTVLIFTRQ